MTAVEQQTNLIWYLRSLFCSLIPASFFYRCVFLRYTFQFILNYETWDLDIGYLRMHKRNLGERNFCFLQWEMTFRKKFLAGFFPKKHIIFLVYTFLCFFPHLAGKFDYKCGQFLSVSVVQTIQKRKVNLLKRSIKFTRHMFEPVLKTLCSSEKLFHKMQKEEFQQHKSPQFSQIWLTQ